MTLEELLEQLPEEERKPFKEASDAAEKLRSIVNREASTPHEQRERDEDLNRALEELNRALERLARVLR